MLFGATAGDFQVFHLVSTARIKGSIDPSCPAYDLALNDWPQWPAPIFNGLVAATLIWAAHRNLWAVFSSSRDKNLKRLLSFFLADWWRGQKWLLRNFSNFSSPKQPPSHVKFCLGIRINSKSTSKKNIKKHSNSILPKIVQRRNSYSNETPNKNHQKIPTSTATNP